MMNNDMNQNTATATLDPESMKIDTKVIKKMIASALVEAKGYLGTANGVMGGLTGMLKKNTTEEEDALSGINVSMKDNEADVTVKVIVEAGMNIPAIVAEITDNVKAKLREVGGIEAKQVHVEVVDMMTKAEYDAKYTKAAPAEDAAK